MGPALSLTLPPVALRPYSGVLPWQPPAEAKQAAVLQASAEQRRAPLVVPASETSPEPEKSQRLAPGPVPRDA